MFAQSAKPCENSSINTKCDASNSVVFLRKCFEKPILFTASATKPGWIQRVLLQYVDSQSSVTSAPCKIPTSEKDTTAGCSSCRVNYRLFCLPSGQSKGADFLSSPTAINHHKIEAAFSTRVPSARISAKVCSVRAVRYSLRRLHANPQQFSS